MARPLTNRRTFIRSLGAASAIGLAGCTGGGNGGNGGSSGTTATPTGKPTSTSAKPSGDIVIGDAAPLSGPIAPWGQLHKAGLEFAAKEINDNGGVLGQHVKIVSQDTQADPTTAATAVQRLVSEEGAIAVSGPVLSNVGIRIRQVAEQAKVPHIPNLAASANLLTKDTRYTFRLAGAATPWLARAIAGYIKQNGWTVYGAIIADYAYGHSYEEAMKRYITSMSGLQSTVELGPPKPGDFTSQLRKMPSDLQFLDVAGHPIAIFDIVQQALQIGLHPAVMTGATLPSGQFYGALGDTVSKGVTTFPPVDVTASDYLSVANRYYKATNKFFDPFVGFGWDTVTLIEQALESAGKADPQALRDAISAIDYDTILSYPSVSYTDWGELKQTKLIGQQFVLDAPSYYPKGKYSFKNVYETDVYGPVDPTNWG